MDTHQFYDKRLAHAFETRSGSIIDPGEAFDLLAEDIQQLRVLPEKITKIGYEQQVAGKAVALPNAVVIDVGVRIHDFNPVN